ncbi:transcription factor bHLH117-like isoform X2 [Cucurbita moschata]|uniref:Transcription factor bHLH117-like isoform X2 n=1 Tax=Cucurbita moschata TaxID=3662 RepID=A0A6J1ES24_CUCMO|nr:transcription factor bHLH117-like isoform X2 [Cucurbita moschata]
MMVESSAGDDGSTNVWDDACFNAMFSGVSLQSFLAGGNQNHCPLLLPSLFGGGYISDALTFPDASTSLYPQPSSNFVAESIESSEPMNVYEQTAFVFHASTSFPHLPDLRSLGQCSSSFNKRARVDSVWNPLQMVEPMMRECEKLLPWDKKMDISTMLEGAFKYVKFLQAQLLALQSMPCESAISTNSNHHISGVFGGLERLSRNQLLQVLVNSPVAQTMLCSQSCCVFSAEQLGLIQKIAEKRVLLQQISTFRHKP